jgi:hypothetical protein
MNQFWYGFFCLSSSMVVAQEFLPVPDASSKRIVPDDGALFEEDSKDKLHRRQLEEMGQVFEENERLKLELEQARHLQATQGMDTTPISPSSPADISSSLGARASHNRTSRRSYGAKSTTLNSGVQVFSVSEAAAQSLTVLPAGSWVRAKLLTGVQANSKYAYNVLMQLDYAYTGPNRIKIPLQGCLVIGGATSDLSIERVIIAPHTLSCVRDSGESIQRPVQGFVAGKDSSNGMTGVFDSKQSKVFLAAALAGIVKGASEAYEIANTQTSVLTSAAGSQAVSRNFTGSFRDLAIARGVGAPAEMVTNWYLEQAKSLLPTIHVGSGQDVWIVMTDRVDVPDLKGD